MHTFARGGSPSPAPPPRRRNDHRLVPVWGGAAFLCTWSKSLACCFSHFAVHRSHLLILIPVGRVCGVRAPGFRGCKGTTLWARRACFLHVSTCGHGSFPGSQLPKANAAPSAGWATSISLWMGQAVLLSYGSGRGEPLSPLRRHGGKCPPLPLTLALPDSQRSYPRLSGYGCGGRGDKQNRRPGAVLFICRVIPPLLCKLSQDVDFDSIHCCISRSQNRAGHILGAQQLFMG